MSHWPTETLRECVDILDRHTDLDAAMRDVNEALDFEVSRHQLRRELQRVGWGSPSEWLHGGSWWQRRRAEARGVVERYDVREAPDTDRAPANDDRVERWALIGDAHVPDHDEAWWQATLNAIEALSVDGICTMGDFGDFESMSLHSGKRADRLVHYDQDLSDVNAELDRLCAVAKRIGCRQLKYIVGNHLDRVRRYVADKAPELYGRVDAIKDLRLAERGFEVIPYGDFGHIGKLMVTHDVGFCGLAAAGRSLAETSQNIAVGHAHNAAIVYRGDVFGETRVGMCCGTGSKRGGRTWIHKAKESRNWQHGLGLAYHHVASGDIACHFLPYVNGRYIVEGRVVT